MTVAPAAELIMVDTPQGSGRLHVDRTDSPGGRVLLLGHGAGGGVNAVDLAALAAALPAQGISVVRYEQPWRVAGRKVAVLPPKLDEAWTSAVAAVRTELAPRWLGFGGRSAGARVACRTADGLGADAVVCLSFPLHPPGRPERTRLPELLTPSVPVLVVQGDRDTFGSADDVRSQTRVRPGIAVVAVIGADHGMKVARGNVLGPAGVRRLVVDTVGAFCRS